MKERYGIYSETYTWEGGYTGDVQYTDIRYCLIDYKTDKKEWFYHESQAQNKLKILKKKTKSLKKKT